jgi:phenylpropionate dioxygenase-like ring-hydroxylating dioxygenase large terminal subunit
MARADRLSHVLEVRVERGMLECGDHGWCYEDTSRCVKIPGLPGEIPKTHVVDRYPSVDRDGLVRVGEDRRGEAEVGEGAR